MNLRVGYTRTHTCYCTPLDVYEVQLERTVWIDEPFRADFDCAPGRGTISEVWLECEFAAGLLGSEDTRPVSQ